MKVFALLQPGPDSQATYSYPLFLPHPLFFVHSFIQRQHHRRQEAAIHNNLSFRMEAEQQQVKSILSLPPLRYATLDGATCSCTHVLSVEAVAPSECNRPCAENPHQYCGGEDGTESYYDTGLRTAGPITSVKFKNVTEDTIAVAWMPPESKSLLDHYLIRAEVLETFSTRQLLDTEWVVSREERQFDLIGLHPGTRYNITIASVGESGLSPDSGSISLVQWTEVGTPDQEPEEPKVLSSDGTSQIIEIRPVINNNGPISNYRLVVIFVTHGLMQTFDESLLRTYNESQEEGTQYYVAAELELNNNSTRRIKIGDGRMYNGFYNAPLPQKSHIHVAVGVISTLNGVTKSIYGQTSHEQHSNLGEDLFALDDEGNSVMIVVLTVFCVILALLLAASVAMFVYVRRHTTSRRKRLTESHELATQNGGGPSHEMENNGFIGDELNAGDFKQQLQELFDRIPSHQLVARNTLSLDIDNILGTGRFGDVIHGNLLRANGATNHGSLGNSSQIHVISEDMEAPDQVLFLKELDQLLRIQPHPMFMTLLGICSTPDWMYIIFEDTGKTLKQRLIESRLPMNANATRLSTLSEEFVLRIMSNIADAMEYLAKHLVGRRGEWEWTCDINGIFISLFRLFTSRCALTTSG